LLCQLADQLHHCNDHMDDIRHHLPTRKKPTQTHKPLAPLCDNISPKNPDFLTHTSPPSQPITTHISQDSTTKKHYVTEPHTTKPTITTVYKPQETKTQPSLISKPSPTNNQATSLPIIQPPPIQTNQTNTETHKETPSENSEPPPLIPTTTKPTTTANTRIPTTIDTHNAKHTNRKT
jgi:hypothetical protein